MSSSLFGDDRCVSGKREVNSKRGLEAHFHGELPWIRHQVSLELIQVDVERTRESQRGGDRADDLRDDSVQGFVVWSFYPKVASANVVNRFIVDHERAIGMLKSRVRCQDGVVRLDDCCCDSWS